MAKIMFSRIDGDKRLMVKLKA